MRTAPLGGPLGQPHLASVSNGGSGCTFASLRACFPIRIERLLGKYNTLPSFLSSQRFSASLFYYWTGCYLPTKKTKRDSHQHSPILPSMMTVIMVLKENETENVLVPWTQACAVSGLSLTVRGEQIVLTPACQPTPCVLLSYPQNLKWRVLAPVSVLRNGKEISWGAAGQPLNSHQIDLAKFRFPPCHLPAVWHGTCDLAPLSFHFCLYKMIRFIS